MELGLEVLWYCEGGNKNSNNYGKGDKKSIKPAATAIGAAAETEVVTKAGGAAAATTNKRTATCNSNKAGTRTTLPATKIAAAAAAKEAPLKLRQQQKLHRYWQQGGQ